MEIHDAGDPYNSNTSGDFDDVYLGVGGVYYQFADAIGSTRAVTDSSGTTCFDQDYYPYGQEIDYTANCIPTYKFTGYEWDFETGNYYAHARYYDPRIGRFLTPDPMDGSPLSPQTLNRYAYVANNPETLIDPSGALLEDPRAMLLQFQEEESGNPFGCTVDGAPTLCSIASFMAWGGIAVQCPGNNCMQTTPLYSAHGDFEGLFTQWFQCFEAPDDGCGYYSGPGLPGGIYYDAQEAGAAAENYAFKTGADVYVSSQGVLISTELGGNVYQVGDSGIYSFTPPDGGPPCTINMFCEYYENAFGIPLGTELAGIYHTHPFGGIFDSEDLKVANSLGVPSFLGYPPDLFPPIGCIWEYVPGQFPAILLQGGSSTGGGGCY